MGEWFDGWLNRHEPVDVAAHHVPWDPNPWHTAATNWPTGASDTIAALADISPSEGNRRQISRQAVFDVQPSGPLATFVAAMVFGFGNRGYGPARTAKMLASHAAAEKIAESHALLRGDGGIDAAHRFMINARGRLAWCRTPFISKYLYFAGFDESSRPQPLIFDSRVQHSLAQTCGVNLRLHYTDDYVAYCTLLASVASRRGVRPDLVELALFQSG